MDSSYYRASYDSLPMVHVGLPLGCSEANAYFISIELTWLLLQDDSSTDMVLCSLI